MNAVSPIEDVAHRLNSVIASGAHPERALDRATKFLERLNAPVRIALLGLPCDEKTRVFNALAGATDAADEPNAIPTELRYGDEEQAEITLSDGTTLLQAGTFDPREHPEAVFVSLRRPLPALKSLSLIDVAADAQAEDQRAAIRWAMSRTDMALWVSPAFSDIEMQIWATAPDDLKDHAYLVLTGRPDGPDAAFLAQHTARVKAMLDYEFLDVVSVGHDVTAETPVLLDEGLEALTGQIRKHADTGRRADADSALMFLNSLERVRSRPVTRPRSRAIPVQQPEDPQELIDLYAQAFTFLRDRGAALLSLIQVGDEPDPLAVLTHCGETLAGLAGLLEKYDDDATASLSALATALAEAEDLLILLGLEDGTGPKIDAVSLLLQLRRELEARLVA
ncbi:MAG: hypothetical protein AAGA71_12380 [Pseudomonadota bacterium]